MTAGHYSRLAALIFSLVAILQIVRAAKGLPITIGQTSIPIWVSWVPAPSRLSWPGLGMQHLGAEPAAKVVAAVHLSPEFVRQT